MQPCFQQCAGVETYENDCLTRLRAGSGVGNPDQTGNSLRTGLCRATSSLCLARTPTRSDRGRFRPHLRQKTESRKNVFPQRHLLANSGEPTSATRTPADTLLVKGTEAVGAEPARFTVAVGAELARFAPVRTGRGEPTRENPDAARAHPRPVESVGNGGVPFRAISNLGGVPLCAISNLVAVASAIKGGFRLSRNCAGNTCTEPLGGCATKGTAVASAPCGLKERMCSTGDGVRTGIVSTRLGLTERMRSTGKGRTYCLGSGLAVVTDLGDSERAGLGGRTSGGDRARERANQPTRARFFRANDPRTLR